jgi:hypothetical protein
MTQLRENHYLLTQLKYCMEITYLLTQSADRTVSLLPFRNHFILDLSVGQFTVQKKTGIGFLYIQIDKHHSALLSQQTGKVSRQSCFSGPSLAAGYRYFHQALYG